MTLECFEGGLDVDRSEGVGAGTPVRTVRGPENFSVHVPHFTSVYVQPPTPRRVRPVSSGPSACLSTWF